ncbi:hypothetical protein AVEN_248677-1 [Araneus ventricosus]|uniref:Uncharacterized protein n=1 Tax=Araneus ventricosus TaxID=182803 RepID=A0A4Y2C290_ARAVE|nr:hypothetical protein AVEN_248677-1 [Araneus ventricosus]
MVMFCNVGSFISVKKSQNNEVFSLLIIEIELPLLPAAPYPLTPTDAISDVDVKLTNDVLAGPWTSGPVTGEERKKRLSLLTTSEAKNKTKSRASKTGGKNGKEDRDNVLQEEELKSVGVGGGSSDCRQPAECQVAVLSRDFFSPDNC